MHDTIALRCREVNSEVTPGNPAAEAENNLDPLATRFRSF